MNRDEIVAQRIKDVSDKENGAPLYTQIMVNAYEGSCSPRQAIKAQCLICVGYDRKAVTHCSGYSCPLWKFRPYQKEGGSE